MFAAQVIKPLGNHIAVAHLLVGAVQQPHLFFVHARRFDNRPFVRVEPVGFLHILQIRVGILVNLHMIENLNPGAVAAVRFDEVFLGLDAVKLVFRLLELLFVVLFLFLFFLQLGQYHRFGVFVAHQAILADLGTYRATEAHHQG